MKHALVPATVVQPEQRRKQDGPVHIGSFPNLITLFAFIARWEKEYGQCLHEKALTTLRQHCPLRREKLAHYMATFTMAVLVCMGEEITPEAICDLCPTSVCHGKSSLIGMS